MSNRSIKCVTVGDGATGKSSLLITYTTNSFPQNYVPTVFDNYNTNIMLDSMPISLALWDTAGQEDYDRLRPLSYPQTDVFLVTFSVTNPTSLHNVEQKWAPELAHYCPGTPFVVVGNKADLRSTAQDPERIVRREQGLLVAKRIGAAAYVETSALHGIGVQECFTEAIKAALNPATAKKSLKQVLVPPILPKAERAPWIYVDSSTYIEQGFRYMLNNAFASDVQFVVDQQTVHAHKAILSAASPLFRRLFQVPDDEVKNDSFISAGDIANKMFPAITSVEHEDDKITRVHIQDGLISYNVFYKVLEFLYCASPTIADKNDHVKELMEAAQLFECPDLVSFATNILEDNQFLNVSLVTWINDERGKKLVQLFFNKPLFSDVSFKLGNDIIFAHRSVLCCHCEVMRAMLSGHFSEGAENAQVDIEETEMEPFLALLQYIYSDHAPIEESDDGIGILMVANQYSLQRLVTLCELYISKSVERATANDVEKADINVIDLLHMTENHNAKQLFVWCRHFLCTNYQPLKKRQDWVKLTGENLKYVEENQWPPLSYWKELEEFEKATQQQQHESSAKNPKNCSIM